MRSPVHLAILGSGSVGSAFAFQLACTGGHDVTVVARPNSVRLQQLQRDHGIVNVDGKRAEVQVADALDEQTPYDLVIVTLLAHQVDSVLPALLRSRAQCILFMFNQFEPERLRDAVGAERCAFGMPFVQASIDSGGRLNARIGAGGQKSLLSEPRWVDLFSAAGMPAVLEPNMLLWLRCHAPWCVAFESVSAAGMRRGGGASWGEAMTLSDGVHECFALIQGFGHRVYPSGKARLNRSPLWVPAGILWLLSRLPSFRELLATGINECRALADVMAAAAVQANFPVNAAKIQAMKLSEKG